MLRHQLLYSTIHVLQQASLFNSAPVHLNLYLRAYMVPSIQVRFGFVEVVNSHHGYVPLVIIGTDPHYSTMILDRPPAEPQYQIRQGHEIKSWGYNILLAFKLIFLHCWAMAAAQSYGRLPWSIHRSKRFLPDTSLITVRAY